MRSPAAEVTRYSSEEISGNESNETHLWTEQERQVEFNRHKEELLKRKRRRKKRTSSSIQSSSFQGKFIDLYGSFIKKKKKKTEIRLRRPALKFQLLQL